MICLIYVIYRLSKWGRDAFGIKIDLACLVVLLVFLKGTSYGLFLKNGENLDTEVLINMAITLSVISFLVISPLLRLIRTKATFTEPTTLEELIKRPTGYESFLEFLNSEFASESLHFWNTVNLYRTRFPTMPDAKDRLEYANEITETFIRPSAVLEVNITSGVKNKIFDTLSACKTDLEEGKDNSELLTLFDPAQAEILKVMSRDNFRRYLKSPQYEAWKDRNSSTRPASRSNTQSNPENSTSDHVGHQPVLRPLVVVTKIDGNVNAFEKFASTPRASISSRSHSPTSADVSRNASREPLDPTPSRGNSFLGQP